MRRESVARRRPPWRNYMRVTMKSASAKSLACERPKPSSSSDVSFERRRREAASKTATIRASERASSFSENQSSVTARSRCWGKAAAPNERTNDAIVLSSSTSSPSSVVKFRVTANEQNLKKKETGYRSWNGVGLQRLGVERR
jgi:hypothetical protein